ncbi:hypothetical protein C2845_PM05G07860 [Panicum miliaceum]|uniref:Uncharacterized protein n=1 Tax=Panicum miliaceum TaxID=4540 RepID=A0A3L6SZJ8_PANMI|nr:hypothetical protein C2845_PM05G07860 [Panicum miliaceum]
MWTSDSDHDIAAAAASSPSSSSSTTSASPPPSPPPASLLRRPRNNRRRRRRAASRQAVPAAPSAAAAAAPEAEDVWRGAQWEAAWPGRRDARPVLLAADDAGGGPGAADDGVGRSRSLTDDDLEELKGCADLGFGFSYDEIPELRGTLPALELCYSMTQRLLDDAHHQHQADPAPPATPVTNWKISSPGKQASVRDLPAWIVIMPWSPEKANLSKSTWNGIFPPARSQPRAPRPPARRVVDDLIPSSLSPPVLTPLSSLLLDDAGDSPDEVKARLKYWAQAVACTVRLCS